MSSLSSIKTTHLLILFLTGSLKRFVVVIPSLIQFTPVNLSLMCIAVVNESNKAVHSETHYELTILVNKASVYVLSVKLKIPV